MSEVRFEVLHRDGTRHLSVAMPDNARSLPVVQAIAKAIGSRILYAVRVKRKTVLRTGFPPLTTLLPLKPGEFVAVGVDPGKGDTRFYDSCECPDCTARRNRMN